MSVSKVTTGPAAQSTLPLAAMRPIAVPYRVPVYIACTVLALITNYCLGKDIAWDTLDYQLYAGFSALNNRFAQDYFAAGPQAYFNPYAYVPFYGLVRAGLPALAIGSILAIAHSIILWLTYELAVLICPSDNRRERFLFGVCAVALAFVNPILMQQIGSSFADITTAELVLAGWLLLVQHAVRKPHVVRIVCAGLILGAASALKLTNAVHAIAAFAVLITLPLSLRARFRHGLVYGASMGIGFAIVAAPWSYRLEQMFGNPLFPLMNSVFRSPEFTVEPLRHFRFIPDTFAEALWRPFAMLDPTSMVHEELRAPDLRYAVLMVLFIAFLFRWLWIRRAPPPTRSINPGLAISARVLTALSCGFVAGWTMWLYGAANSRYFLPMACVAAVLVVGLLFRFFAAQPKVRNYILAAIFLVQGVQLWMGTDYRWNAASWGGPWLDVSVPGKLRTEPSLYLTAGTQSNSYIAPYLAAGAGMINFSGIYAFGSEGANGARVSALIGRYSPHLRVLLRGAKVYEDDEPGEPRRFQVDAALERFSLRVDTTDCSTITVNGLPSEVALTSEASKPVERASANATDLVSCHLVPDSTDHSALIAQQHAADLVLDRLEDACPKLFQPRRLLTEHQGRAWRRYYVNTDIWAWVSDGWVKFYQSQRGSFRSFVGRESDWTKAPLRLACGRRDGVYFAKVLDPK
jgi:Glycosyltransferase family 87